MVRSTIENLYRTHGPVVYRRACSILGDEQEASEVLQDVFARLLQDPTQVQDLRSPLAFLYAATTRRCLNRVRDRATRTRLLEQHMVSPQPITPARAELRGHVRDLLARLPDEQAQAFVYSVLDGMSQAEIASLMGCSRRHVGNLLERARITLREEDERRC